MSDTKEDLEAQLRAMFESQEQAVLVADREWSGEADAWPLHSKSQSRRAYVAVGIAAGIVIFLAALPLVARSGAPVKTGQKGPAGQRPAGQSVSGFHTESPQVSLTADAVSIDVDGKKYVTASPVQVHSDPGIWQGYTTLELAWLEHGVEMRLSVYFTSDGHQWWSDEIRTYDGRADGKWVFYKGDFFRSPLGTPFVGNLDVTASDHGVTGHLQMTGLHLEAFLRPAPCRAPTAPYAIDAGYPSIEMQLSPQSGFGVNATLLDTAACAPVKPDGYTFAWSVAAPSISTVTGNGLRADLTPKAIGTTAVRVTATDKASGTVVATADIPVVVTKSTPASPTTGVKASP
ncbi:MAG: hypothetical protein QOF81_2007 [Acidimicrobiaceae bacterium]|nr:hypothetical protein [Acidimicrobiaceae bacterium]